MQREMFAMLRGEAIEQRIDLIATANARKERALLVFLVSSHGAREECGDVADRIHVRRRAARFSSGPRQVLEAFLESPVGSLELSERISNVLVHFLVAKAAR